MRVPKVWSEKRFNWPGFLIYGPAGYGKTSLALLILWQHGIKTGEYLRFVKCETLLTELDIQNWGGKELRAEAMRRVMEPVLLIIDDVGFREYPPEKRALLLEAIIGRLDMGHPTILTTNALLSTEGGKRQFQNCLDSRVYDRFRDWKVNADGWGSTLRAGQFAEVERQL